MSCYVIKDANNYSEQASLLRKSGITRLSYSLKDSSPCSIRLMNTQDPAYETDLRSIQEELNLEIVAGSYPQEQPLNFDNFSAYFCSHAVFFAYNGDIVSVADGNTSASNEVSTVEKWQLLGAFYVKPNFPGRCGHICNGGFVVAARHRGKGVGTALAAAFERVAPALGYKAAFFNLVFKDNPVSVKLWKNMGYTETGTVPSAKYDKDGRPVDAAMMYKAFENLAS